uniref:Uncharacterized protein n=1 Tax=Arundo donax TaxID=35708 RepID=A0A0A8Z0A8_ARUDO
MYAATWPIDAFRSSLKFHSSGKGYLPLGLYSFISSRAFTTASCAFSPSAGIVLVHLK